MMSHAFTDTANTRIGRAVQQLAAPRPGLTGARALLEAREAFVARYAMARGAERSIDVQTYIWRADTSGSLLAEALWDAADRGVRVRVLLDDANTSGLDAMLSALDAHPHIEIRLFNPFANRSWRVGDLALDFGRVNRRMHNKSFTVDNQATVVGGRNIGDEYLGAETPVAFTDLDVLAIGAAVPEVSSVFDRYWNSASAWPVSALLPPPSADVVENTRAYWAQRRQRPEAMRYLEAVRQLPLLAQMMQGTLALDWVPARVLSDAPEKVLQPAGSKDAQMLPQLAAEFADARRELALVSPYFVPGTAGVQTLVDMAGRGVQVEVLTNSLAATDVGVVYSGYARYREQLLRGGVRLYELKPAALPDAPPAAPSPGVGGSRGGSSSASLHAKTFASDRSRIFVGSFNLDPRSIALNTEMGMVLESPALATRLSNAFRVEIPRDAYELRLEGDKVVWMERTDAGEVRHASAPGIGFLRGLWVGLLALLPIEWLL
jgi:putative cardiolipin synthase